MAKVIKSFSKVVKKVVSSKIGKALLIGATIYLGGAALGAWSSPFQSINGALVKGGTTAAAGSGAAGGANTAAITNAVNTTMGAEGAAAGASTAATNTGLIASRIAPAGIPSMTVTGTSAAAPAFTASQTAGLGLTGASSLTAGMDPNYTVPSMADTLPASTAQQVTNGVNATVNAGQQTGGIISRMMNGVSAATNWAKDNPLTSAMLASGAASAMSPDQIDVLREQEDLRRQREEEERQRQEGNLNVGTINLPRYKQAPMKFASTDQPVFNNGLINARRTI